MNSFHQLTSKRSSQLSQFGSGQGWTRHRKPSVCPSPADLFAGWFVLCDSCQFPAPTAGKGPVSLHCPRDIYCLVTALGPGWQQLVLQAGMGVPSLAEAMVGQGRQLGSARCCWRPSSSGTTGPWDGWREAAVQCHSQALLLVPALAAWGGLSPPSSSPLVPETSPRLIHRTVPQQEHQRGQCPHTKEKCLHPPYARNICPQGTAGFTSAASQGQVLKCASNPAPRPFLSQCQPVAVLPRLGLTCSGTWQVSGSCKIQNFCLHPQDQRVCGEVGEAPHGTSRAHP